MQYVIVISQFTEHGIEGVVPLELLPNEVRAKYQAKPSERTKRTKKEDTKNSAQQAEENQVPERERNLTFAYVLSFRFFSCKLIPVAVLC